MSIPDEEAKELRIINGWLVEAVDDCTCGTGPGGYYGHHESGCGNYPLVRLDGLDGWPTPKENDQATTIEDAPTPDASPLWRDSDREDWMREGSIHLELVDAPYVSVAINPAWIARGTSVMVEDYDDETVSVSPENLPALIAMLQEVQRRIGGDSC